MTEIQPPWALQGGVVFHPANLSRRMWAGILDEGICRFNGDNDLKAQQQGTPSMNVDILKGAVFIKGDDSTDQGLYFAYNDGTISRLLAAPVGNPRKDLIVARVKDASEGQAGDTWLVDVITGTEAASPAEPPLPATAYKLAVVNLTVGMVQIVNSNIEDKRVVAPLIAREQLRGVKVYRSTAQSIASATDVELVYDTANGAEEFDTDAFHDFTTNPSRLQVPAGLAGYYEIKGFVSWDANASEFRSVVILLNGATTLARSRIASSGSAGATAHEVSAIKYLNVGDYVELRVRHGSSGNRSITAGTSDNWFMMRRIAT
jgi:hypothetical protein